MALPPLYSRTYLVPSLPISDSPRFRVRLTALYDAHVASSHGHTVAAVLRRELGVEMPYYTGYQDRKTYRTNEFIRDAETRDLLDLISIVYSILATDGPTAEKRERLSSAWRAEADRILREEHLPFLVAENGSVRRRLDDEFERNVSTLITGLSNQKLANVQKAVEQARDNLLGLDPDRKTAVRYIYEAVEILVKTLTGESRLNTAACLKLGSIYAQVKGANDPHATNAAKAIFKALDDWSTAFQEYRHGQTSPEPVEPTEEIAIFAVSSGASYVRLLADMVSLSWLNS